MRFNGNILGVDNRASVGNTRGLWTLPPQSQARRRGAWSVFDQDAATYIAAVEAQDQQELELEIKSAIHAFVAGCKTDGIWGDIKACAILCGARTLDGALIALVGTNPTNNNFVSGDYDRANGLTGNGSTKYIDTNRNNNADPQDDNHNALYFTKPDTGSSAATGYMVGTSAANNNAGSNQITTSVLRNRNSASDAPSILGINGMNRRIGLYGMSRDNGSTYNAIAGGIATVSVSRASQTPYNGNVAVFNRNLSGSSATDARVAFYSIGEATDLVLLSNNATRLVGTIQGFLS
jgi:hypothetical protein